MDFFAFATMNARTESKSTYKCWNCGQTAEHGKPHACDVDADIRESFKRINRTRACYRCGEHVSACRCSQE